MDCKSSKWVPLIGINLFCNIECWKVISISQQFGFPSSSISFFQTQPSALHLQKFIPQETFAQNLYHVIWTDLQNNFPSSSHTTKQFPQSFPLSLLKSWKGICVYWRWLGFFSLSPLLNLNSHPLPSSAYYFSPCRLRDRQGSMSICVWTASRQPSSSLARLIYLAQYCVSGLLHWWGAK